MSSKRRAAIKLRRQGKSYNEISKELSIAKSTLSGWFSDLDWSQKLRGQLTREAQKGAEKRLRAMSQERKKKWEQWRQKARDEAEEEFVKLQSSPLFIAGIMLYWAEGDSKIENSIVRLTNTDPRLIKIYVLFLEKICGIPKKKIKIAPIIYPDLDEKKCRQYWSKISNISLKNFTKTQFIKGKHPTRRLDYGICNVIVSSRALKERIFVWINLFSKEF